MYRPAALYVYYTVGALIIVLTQMFKEVMAYKG